MHSAIGIGRLTHCRLSPRKHEFTYQLKQVLLDLSGVEDTLTALSLCGYERGNVCSFHARDYCQIAGMNVDDSIRRLYTHKTGRVHDGKVFLLTQLRHWGYVFNPLSVYFFTDASGEHINACVLEVHNTPWNEKHRYVISELTSPKAGVYAAQFRKHLHVSPFMEQDFDYHLHFKWSPNQLILRLENLRDNELYFTATMSLDLQPLSGSTWIKSLIRYPFTPLKASLGIYWQAFLLWCKGIKFVPYSKRDKSRPWS